MHVEADCTHLEAPLVPMALRALHRRTGTGALARITLAGPPGTGAADPWTEQRLEDVLEGAGFTLETPGFRGPLHTGELHLDDLRGDHPGRGDVPHRTVAARRLDTLADTVGPCMRLLLVGLNPSPHAVASGVGFSGPSNRGWPALLASGLASVDRDADAMLRYHRIGMTDLVKRATRRASELTVREYASGLQRLERLCAWLSPAAVCVVGLSGWRAAVERAATPGRQERALGGRPVWLMPNPSGLNAHAALDDLVEHMLAAAALADEHRH